MTEILSQRGLNRATLARQYLLNRVPVRAIDAIEHLGGMQSQAPLTHAAEFSAHFRRSTERVDLDSLLRQATRLLDEQPRTRAELGKLLAERWPDADPSALAYAATHHIALCQVPPRGVWGNSSAAAWTPVERWLGAPLRAAPVDKLVLRYLGAFGPATVGDVQLWSGLTKLREVVERLPLRTFHGQAGQTLYDLPDAPRPSADTPAPPRFLPAYDNLLLSHKDRTRVILDNRPVPLPPGNGANMGTFLVDGTWQGTWQVRNQSLHIKPFTKLRPADHDALLTEATQLCAFLAPQTKYALILDEL